MNIIKHSQWLKSVGMKAEAEGLIIEAQEKRLMTRNYRVKLFLKRAYSIRRKNLIN